MILIAFCEGFLHSHHLTFFFMYTKFYKLELLTCQTLETILAVIVCFNPLFGYISDHFQICGSKRKSYLVILSFFGTIGYIFCGLSFYISIPVSVIFALNFLIDVCNTFRNVIVDSICVINHNIAKFKLKTKKNITSNSSVSTLFAFRLCGRALSIILFGTIYNYLEGRCFLISHVHLGISLVDFWNSWIPSYRTTDHS